ncbi:MAG: class I SAM-dependent methyltransferase [Gammaproteobacteria bacterium]|nr:class I SAM-dependent methyltransferase [Gammaproteobacteria bacterium]
MSGSDPYDQFSYESIPFQDSHPRHLACLGRLFELPAAEPEFCRVLELGCATGGNLIPMAWYQPRAQFIGIDLSANQIRQGQALISELGLTNIELRQGNILDLGAELGGFDYIIAHGVYSWVPEPVRERLLSLARELLNPSGLFYLSFNTLPGWRMRGMLRDILRHSCRGISDVRNRLGAAYAALTRLETAVQELQALSARYLREEIKYLRAAHPSYLLYEYLAEENRAFLFSEFLQTAHHHRLDYLCDTQLSYLFPSTFGEATERALEDIADDMELEQWLDFVSTRNFRRSVLCRDDATPAAELSLDAFAEFSFGSDLTPPKRVDLRHHKPSVFHQPDATPVEVRHPLSKALLLEMHERQPDLLHLRELLPGAEQRLFAAGGREHAQAYDGCLMELFSLFAHRALTATPTDSCFSDSMGPAPCTNRLAKAQVRRGYTYVATARHTSLDLDSLSARLVLLLDGKRNSEELAGLLMNELQAGTLEPPPGLSLKSWSQEKLRTRFEQSCRELIGLFSRQGVLTSASAE